MKKFIGRIKFWYKNSRPRALPQSMIPCLIAIAYANHEKDFSIILSVLALIGVFFAHLSSNLFDDYFDYKNSKSSLRDELKHQGFRARIAKCPYLTSNQATVKELLIVAVIFFIIGIIVASIILLFRGEVILYFIIITALLVLSYSSKPLKLSYRGFGELQVGFMFGPLLMTGVYYASCGVLNFSLLYIFIPTGLFVMNIIYVHSIMDLTPDIHVGKMTLAVKIRNKYLNLAFLIFINSLTYIIILIGIYKNFLSDYYFLALLTMPLSISLIYLMIKYITQPDRKFSPVFLMGPTKDYKLAKKLGNDWFMIRWLLARNLIVYFSIIIIILALLNK